MSTLHVDFIDGEGARSEAFLQPYEVLQHLVMHDTRNIRDACSRIIRDRLKQSCMGIVEIKLEGCQ